jgi:V/A-type H+/Na+-transporting ATPase subunit I
VIVKMSKVQVLGPKRLLTDVLAFLQQQGALQLRPPPTPRRRASGGPLLRAVRVAPEQAAEEHALNKAVERIDALIEALPRPEPAPRAASGGAEGLPDATTPEFLARLDALEAEMKALQAKRAALAGEKEVVGRYGRLLVAISPLKPDLSPDVEPHTLGLVIRRAHPEALQLLEREVFRITEGLFDLQTRPVDDELTGVLLTVPAKNVREISALLFERGVEEIKLPAEYSGQSMVQAMSLLLKREREIPDEVRAIEGEVSAFSAKWEPVLRRVRSEAADRLARLKAFARCGETGLAFLVAGWVPRERLEALKRATVEQYRAAVTIVEYPFGPEEYGEVPVVLRNPKWLKPFELLLSLMPLPRYGSIDPTPYLAIFFPLFLGLILGDVAFGVIVLAAALVVRRTGWGGPMVKDVTAVAIACGVSTILFGFLFGEALGGLGAHLGLRPILLDRAQAFVSLLIFALALGALHVVLGMVLGIVDAARNLHVREAFTRTVKIGLLVATALGIGGVTGYVPVDVGRWAMVSVGALLVAGIITGGFMVPLELVLALGNILSYARLMALGLASVLLADVANRIAASVKPTVLGVTIAIVLYAANLAMALISPTVAALRLHYVEFFEKFYEGGGEPYRPFALGT